MYTCMGKNNNGLAYCRLIKATILYLLTTVLYFLYNTLAILCRDTVLFLSLIFPCKYTKVICNACYNQMSVLSLTEVWTTLFWLQQTGFSQISWYSIINQNSSKAIDKTTEPYYSNLGPSLITHSACLICLDSGSCWNPIYLECQNAISVYQ